AVVSNAAPVANAMNVLMSISPGRSFRVEPRNGGARVAAIVAYGKPAIRPKVARRGSAMSAPGDRRETGVAIGARIALFPPSLDVARKPAQLERVPCQCVSGASRRARSAARYFRYRADAGGRSSAAGPQSS